jgi:hypothetical protein
MSWHRITRGRPQAAGGGAAGAGLAPPMFRPIVGGGTGGACGSTGRTNGGGCCCRGTIMTVLPDMVALQNVLVAKGTPSTFDGTDKVTVVKITSPQMRNGVGRVVCRESFIL